MRLLDGKASPATKGLVYAQIAYIYAHDGLTDPDKVLAYGTKALELPLDVETACKVYISTAGALEVKRRVAHGEEAQELTKSLWKVCLEGLDFVLRQNPPPARRDLPAVNKFDCGPDDEACKELIEKHRQEMEERKRAELDNELVLYRDIFLEKCNTLYSEANTLYSETDDKTRDALRDATQRLIADEERARYILDVIMHNDKSEAQGK